MKQQDSTTIQPEITKPLIYILSNKTFDLKKIANDEMQELENAVSSVDEDKVIDTALDIAINLSGFAGFPTNYLLRKFGKLYANYQTKRNKESGTSEADKSEENKNIKATVIAYFKKANINLIDWIDSIQQIPFSNIPSQIKFPPGHPLPRQLYRNHPLNEEAKHYIPIEVFDSLLYEERESELIKLLVDLGAISITIKDLSNVHLQGLLEGKVSATGAGGIEGKIEGGSEKSILQNRSIKLSQKKWDSDNFDEANYKWLSYEPSWKTLVHARLKGKCLSSSVELNSNASYSISANMGLSEGLISQISDLKAGFEFSNLEKTSKLFEVTFLDE